MPLSKVASRDVADSGKSSLRTSRIKRENSAEKPAHTRTLRAHVTPVSYPRCALDSPLPVKNNISNYSITTYSTTNISNELLRK